MFFHSNGPEVNGINYNRVVQGQDYTVDEESLLSLTPITQDDKIRQSSWIKKETLLTEGFWCAESESGLEIYPIRQVTDIFQPKSAKNSVFCYIWDYITSRINSFSGNGSHHLKVPVLPFRNVFLFSRYHFFFTEISFNEVYYFRALITAWSK